MPPILELIRPLNCILAGVAVLIGAVIATGNLNIPELVLFSAFATAALVAGGGNAVNDYFDRDIDRVNRPHRPIPSGRITPRTALIIAQILFLAGIALTVFLNIYCLLLAALNSVVLFIYTWKLKRRGFVGNISIGYLVGSTLLFGGLATAHLRAEPLIPSGLLVLVLMASLSTIGRELIKAIEDMKGDRELGFKTFPLGHGVGKTAVLAIGFLGAAIALSPIPYLLGIFGWQYLALLIISIIAFLVAIGIMVRSRGPKAAGKSSLACKIGMALGLLAFLAGTFL